MLKEGVLRKEKILKMWKLKSVGILADKTLKEREAEKKRLEERRRRMNEEKDVVIAQVILGPGLQKPRVTTSPKTDSVSLTASQHSSEK